MEDLRKCAADLRELTSNIINNFKEDIESIKQEFLRYNTTTQNVDPQEMLSNRKFIAVVPLPREIHINEKIEVVNGSYYVNYEVKCGLRVFNTRLYLGEKPNGDALTREMRKCIESAIAQCLERDSGQLQEVGEGGKIINIRHL